ncbi:MAG: type II toxin-antitoxin system VapC family toxin [Deltaproteobacteria bacterium]|nr:type II toxin-antitoxin system VapC family toxin [Deltaproteobacteria bacterium]
MIVLDTHAWVWFTSDPDRLSARARKAIRASKDRSISAMSCWEVAMLVSRGRLALDRDPLAWMEESLRTNDIELLPLTPTIGVVSVAYGGFRGDPVDRVIVATAQVHAATLVTKDHAIIEAGLVPVVW